MTSSEAVGGTSPTRAVAQGRVAAADGNGAFTAAAASRALQGNQERKKGRA